MYYRDGTIISLRRKPLLFDTISSFRGIIGFNRFFFYHRWIIPIFIRMIIDGLRLYFFLHRWSGRQHIGVMRRKSVLSNQSFRRLLVSDSVNHCVLRRIFQTAHRIIGYFCQQWCLECILF